MQEEEIFGTIGEYTLTLRLGSGTYAQVYKATIDFNHYFACKFIIIDKLQIFLDKDKIEMLKKESSILTKIVHPNICKSYFEDAKEGVLNYSDKNSTPKNVIYTLLECIHCGDLFDYIGYTKPFSEKMGRYIFKNMISGLKYLHENGYVHRDIKPDNIVLDKNYNPKLIDFGLASPILGNDNNGHFTSGAGTESYMAPEVLNEQPYYLGSPADIFSAGVTLFRLIMKLYPFRKADVMTSKHYEYIASKSINDLWNSYRKTKHIQNATQEFKNLIVSLLAYNPLDRLTFDQILNHPWMNGPYPDDEEIFQKFSLKEIKIIEIKKKIRENSKDAFDNKKIIEEGKKDQPQEAKKDLSGGELIEMESKVVRRYDRPYGFITAQELYFEDQFILQFIVEYVKQRGGNSYIHDKYMSVSVDMFFETELVKFNAEVMKDKDINVLVIDKKEGDKLDFYSIYHEMIDCMIKAYC